MNSTQLEFWKRATEEHIQSVRTLMIDDREIKEMFVEHLRQFFIGFEMVEFSKDFRVVTMKWAWDDEIEINKNIIGDFNMDWILRTGSSSDGGANINVVVFPFGRGD